jgi:hypothetical protein
MGSSGNGRIGEIVPMPRATPGLRPIIVLGEMRR